MCDSGVMQSLDAAVAHVYRAFAAYHLRDTIIGCPDCIDAAMEMPLRSKALPMLTADDLNPFSASAMTTWGDLEDYKHFLPRLLELAAHDTTFHFEYVTYKLDYSQWNTWPHEERAALVHYLDQLWRTVLSAFPSPLRALPAGDWLTWLQAITPDLAGFLEVWRADTRLAATRHLAALIRDVLHGKTFDRPLGGRMPAGQDETVRVLTWLCDVSTKTRLEKAFFEYLDDPQATELSDAVAQCDWLPTLLNAYSV